MAKKRSKSSGAWLQRHVNDPYVKEAQRLGFRSRAAFKLLEILERDKLIKNGMTIIDLGAAPGGWSQVIADLVGKNGRVIATDILPMDTLAGVEFIQGDFTSDAVFEQLLSSLDNKPADLVISDIAPNLSGVRGVDQPRAMYLVELALDMAIKTLKPDGAIIFKLFQGEGYDELLLEVKQRFSKVLTRKPSASRPKSREMYLVAKGFKAI